MNLATTQQALMKRGMNLDDAFCLAALLVKGPEPGGMTAEHYRLWAMERWAPMSEAKINSFLAEFEGAI